MRETLLRQGTERVLLCLSLFLVAVTSARFVVHTRDGALVAVVGSDVLLPCMVSPALSTDGLKVLWFHNNPKIVTFSLINGREDRQTQSAAFRGRSFLEGQPDHGNLSIVLRNIHLSDIGKYHCIVENITTNFYEEAVLELQVVGLGSPPLIAVSLKDNAVVLSCSSFGWFPEPTMTWRKENGDQIPSDPVIRKDSANGLYQVQSMVQLKDSTQGKIYCGSTHNATERESGLYVTVSDAIFPRTSPWAVVFWLLLILILVVSPVVGWLFYSRLKAKETQLLEREDYIGQLKREIEWRKISVIKESMLFDRLTAYRGLLVSPDCRNISTSNVIQDVPENHERFDTEPCVLGQTPISSGTHYWETEIQEQGGKFWSIGIANQSVRRAGGQRECPEAGIWAIRALDEGYLALSTPPEPITLSKELAPRGFALLNHQGMNEPRRIQRVGTFLDYDNGVVSFYDVDSYDRLYTYRHEFNEPVYAFYYVGPGIAFSLQV